MPRSSTHIKPESLRHLHGKSHIAAPQDPVAAFSRCRQRMNTTASFLMMIYYGACDSCIALATGSVRCLLSWLAQIQPRQTQTLSGCHNVILERIPS
jgi:hypothetical protein